MIDQLVCKSIQILKLWRILPTTVTRSKAPLWGSGNWEETFASGGCGLGFDPQPARSWRLYYSVAGRLFHKVFILGHGGAKVARYAAIHLHRYIVKRPEYKKGDMTAAIREGFLECDRAMREDADLRDEMAGATAVTVLMRDGQVWCGNAGDSRCIASVQGRAQALSTDHKPNDPAERERIEAAGGFVEFNRVNGNLALSRALGDFLFKMNDGLSQVRVLLYYQCCGSK